MVKQVKQHEWAIFGSLRRVLAHDPMGGPKARGLASDLGNANRKSFATFSEC